MLRAVRDTTWIDRVIPVNNWNDELNNNSIKAIESIPETVTLDGIEYKRDITIEDVPANFNTELSNTTQSEYNMDNSNNAILTKANVSVSWNSGGKDFNLTIPVVLTNWKPGF